MQRRKAVVMGAGGLVAQRLQQRLAHHPWFELAAVVGSPRYVGQGLDKVPWGLPEDRPELPPLTVGDIADPATAQALAREGVTVAFSALPAEEAKALEPMWSNAGITVFSNASAFRRHPGVPLVIPEVNADALKAPLTHACATNCTLLPLVLPCAALEASFGIAAFEMRSEQGLSGGGFAYMNDALERGDVAAEIPGEAEKTEAEFRHVLDWGGEAALTCARVMREDGHHVYVTATLKREATVEQAVSCLKQWSEEHRFHHLPSSPHQPLMMKDKINVERDLYADGEGNPLHPDPAFDLKAGMAITVANLSCPTPFTVQFEAYSHNTLRGAAGGLVYLAELAVSEELA